MYDYNKKLIFITVSVVVAVMVVILALFNRNTQTASSSTSSAASSSSAQTSTVSTSTASEIEQLCQQFYEATIAGDSTAQEEAYNKMTEHFQNDPSDTAGQATAQACINEAVSQVSQTNSATENTENTDTEEASTSGEVVE